jgi:hypothetical protein
LVFEFDRDLLSPPSESLLGLAEDDLTVPVFAFVVSTSAATLAPLE